MIASLGGYVNRANADPPGVKIIWKGLSALANFTEAWDTFGPEAQAEQDIFVKKRCV
ncbi:MAG: hypothetical protein ACI9S8_001405 [Chlamydiales bacterium]